MSQKNSWIQRVVLTIITWYQVTLSPDHGAFKHKHPHGYCRYTPTCSQYGYAAVEKYGVVRGLGMALWRVLRCNPWSKGGYDPVK